MPTTSKELSLAPSYSDTPLKLNKEQQQYVSDLSEYESEKSKDALKIDEEQFEELKDSMKSEENEQDD
ncbi:MAG: hypothetical protein HRT73_05140 [Flavobacteriales bacterium]|nr:hypothetical protein [Flavobacteriales bacterium]